MSNLNEEEIKVFTGAVAHYFSQLTREAATVRGAYLDNNNSAMPPYGFTGQITVSGLYRGSITLSAPRAMIRHLLMAMKEPDHSDDNLRDTIGEIANTLAGNARKHFGERMEISVPITAIGPLAPEQLVRARPYVITVNWKSYNALLVVDIERLD